MTLLRSLDDSDSFITDNKAEIIAGDALVLASFSLYKQIASIIFAPDFPGPWSALVMHEFAPIVATHARSNMATGLGWLAPLKFDPIRSGKLQL